MFSPTVRTALIWSIFCLSLLKMPSVLGEEESASGSDPAEQNPATITLKRKVAIARFSNETRSGSSFLVNESGDRVGKQASDILSARLTDTGLFLLFERIDADKINAEQVLSSLKNSGVAVDYLIVGSVSEFGRASTSDTGVFSRKKEQKAYAKVNVRLIDVKSGRILLAQEGAGEATTETKKTFGVGSSAAFDQTLTDKAISAAISQVISNLVENMTSTPWRSYILAEDAGLYMIAGGENQGLVPGTTVSVYRRGSEVKNPQTGAVITLPGKWAATLRVISNFGDDEFSEGSVTEMLSGTIGPDLTEYEVREE